MKIEFGVSSACYYPSETEKSLQTAGEYGYRNVELFLNSPSELEDEYLDEIIAIKEKYNLNIVSVHPLHPLRSHFIFLAIMKEDLRTLCRCMTDFLK